MRRAFSCVVPDTGRLTRSSSAADSRPSSIAPRVIAVSTRTRYPVAPGPVDHARTGWRHEKMSPTVEIFIVVAAGLLSGFINTLASSGSAVTLPLMILLGLPATVANGTNRVPLLAGALAALFAFHRAGVLEWRNGLVFSIPLIVGTVAGAALASVLDARVMGWAVVVAVVAALIMLVSNPKRFLRGAAPDGPRVGLFTAALFVPIGVWAGFIVLDSATYMLLGLVVVVGYDLIRANAIKSLFLLWISLASLLVFYVEGEVDWRIGVWLAAGSIVGSWTAGLLATKEWAKVWVFRLLVIVILAEIGQLLHRFGVLRF